MLFLHSETNYHTVLVFDFMGDFILGAKSHVPKIQYTAS